MDPLEQAADPVNVESDVIMRDAIDKALASLPEDLRVAITLRDVQGLDYREIASVLERADRHSRVADLPWPTTIEAAARAIAPSGVSGGGD